MSEAAQMFTDGAAYERRMGRWSRLVGEIFLDWIAAPPGLRWVDVGCGNGAFTEVLIARCKPAAVSGVDPSEGQLSYARTRPGTKLAEFRLGDAQQLPYVDRSFDAATMALAISFIPDPLKAVREMMRVVRPRRRRRNLHVGSPGRRHSSRPDVPGAKIPRRHSLDAGRRGDAARGYAKAVGAGRSAIDRNARDPHSGCVCGLRRFLGVIQGAGGTRRTSRSARCRRPRSKTSRCGCASTCRSPPTAPSRTNPSPMR